MSVTTTDGNPSSATVATTTIPSTTTTAVAVAMSMIQSQSHGDLRSTTPGLNTSTTSNSSANANTNSTNGSTTNPNPNASSQNFSSLVSTILKTTGKEPAPLVGPSTTIVGDVLYVFGGRILSRSRPQLTSDMYALDLTTRVWRKLETHGTIPPPRYFHSVCALGDTKLVCFGGMSPANAVVPGGGAAGAAASGGGAGGTIAAGSDQQNEVMVMSDIHVFDVPTYTWTCVPTANPPEGRYAHCATILPTTAFFTAEHTIAAAMVGGERLDGFGGAEMVVVGGQDSANHYIEEINVFNLRSLTWTSKSPLNRSCGAYRSVVVPLGNSLSVDQIGAGMEPQTGAMVGNVGGDPAVGLAAYGGKQKDPNAMLIYSNYNFLDVKLELQIRIPDGSLIERTMNGPHSPPGLRFPNGGVLDNHFVVSGTYLTASKQEYALWALDLRTLIWSRIDAGQVFSQGSWNRGVLWNRRSSFLILGSRGRSLVEDYNHRRINFTNLCKVDLEAFGLYENWRKTSAIAPLRPSSSAPFLSAAEELGRMFMQMPELADMEFVCMDGETVPVNSRVIAKRWGPYFVQLLNSTNSDNITAATGTGAANSNLAPQGRITSMATITPQSLAAAAAATGTASLSTPAITKTTNMTSQTLSSSAAAHLLQPPSHTNLSPLERPRALYFPHCHSVVATLTEFLYTGSLPAETIAPVLCSLLQISRPYRVEGLLEAVVERVHTVLDGRNAAAVFNAAATAAGSGSGVDAVYADDPDRDDADDDGTITPRSPCDIDDGCEDEWWEKVNIIGLQKRGLRGLMEGRRMRERGRSMGARGSEPPTTNINTTTATAATGAFGG